MVQTLACFELHVYLIHTLNRTLLLLLLLLYLHVDDNEGSRTIAGINNRRGIVHFKIAYSKDTLNKPLGVRNLSLNQIYRAYFPVVNDGETLKFWLTARDVLGNELTVPNIVRLDNSEPVLGKPHTEVNVFNESDAVPFGTRSVDKRATNCYLCCKIKMLELSYLISYGITSHKPVYYYDDNECRHRSHL